VTTNVTIKNDQTPSPIRQPEQFPPFFSRKFRLTHPGYEESANTSVVQRQTILIPKANLAIVGGNTQNFGRGLMT